MRRGWEGDDDERPGWTGPELDALLVLFALVLFLAMIAVYFVDTPPVTLARVLAR